MNTSEYARYRSWKSWDSDGFGILDKRDSAYYKSEMSKSGLNDLKGLKVLEIGFGNGSFAAWCKQEGAHYSGTEIIPELVIAGQSAGYNVFNGDIGLDSIVEMNSIDLIVAIDVLEHFEIDDLQRAIAEAKLLLRSGGLIFARIPSGDSPFARFIQYGDLTHKTVLGSSAIRQIAGDIGFNVEQVREPTFLYFGLHLSAWIKRLIILFIRKLIFFFIIKLIMGNGSPILTPNLIFVFKKK